MSRKEYEKQGSNKRRMVTGDAGPAPVSGAFKPGSRLLESLGPLNHRLSARGIYHWAPAC
ncbi:hypothetical protein C4K37_2099 [Pseudomonas chlororaphis subsp. piscium]|nr:hypothetical protein C4K37_2099 [Pseudomonas chlororaphis subsp. piscium]AZC43040.1 hypothetical protein C4K36_2106 [Pseudomonas chlororaphis subsp. piscium]